MLFIIVWFPSDFLYNAHTSEILLYLVNCRSSCKYLDILFQYKGNKVLRYFDCHVPNY